ncbi:hypothetical protein L211DRAFT_849767 [Terfezia boudieri ATCC MYA-4762]|uniref:FMN-dependent dehydrogenase domain-containing protein n=1 Tax=Terfezia boudieri ATCC MYA-4762 TaxID=1051890 RepID=A0A3N4LPC3_9PEZI|nr:hypothetical protein L211DRAFT_849767 [Terfezia boudieri ATCC MYA-4762]
MPKGEDVEVFLSLSTLRNWVEEKKVDDVGFNVQQVDGEAVDSSQDAARAISSFVDPSLSWKDIPPFRKITKNAHALKDVQRIEDALKAVEYGVAAASYRYPLKALCLGAKGVGIGRPFLYAMNTYGQSGVERAMQLLKAHLANTDFFCDAQDELEMSF